MTSTIPIEELGLVGNLVTHAALYMSRRGYYLESVHIEANEKPLLTVRLGPEAKEMSGKRVEGKALMEARIWNCRVQWRLE